MNIEVFYHVYIPPDHQGSMRWTWYVDQQLSLIRDSSLHKIANVNLCATMPMHWCHSVTNEPLYQTFNYYVSTKYPFVKILDIRDTGHHINIYEGQTIERLYRHCIDNDSIVLYFHSKGAASNQPQVTSWRDVLNHYCIGQWTTAVRAIQRQDIDLVGVRDAVCKDHMVSGNFWWSKSEYIRRLPEPLQSQVYQTGRPRFYPGGPDYRYSFEDWVWTPKSTSLDRYKGRSLPTILLCK